MATFVLLVFLAIVWAGVGVYWFRTRMPSGPSLSFGSARRSGGGALALLAGPARGNGSVVALRRPAGPTMGTAPGRSLAPVGNGRQMPSMGRGISSQQARLRRRNVLVTLAAISVATLILVFTVGGTGIIALHLLADALLLGFVLALVQYQREIEHERTLSRPVYAAPRTTSGLAATGTDDVVGVGTRW